MSFSAAVEWWEEWQLRLLVLASLFLQYFLFAAALLRKRRVYHWFRALIWLAYQGCDVVAIYALATLFNRHKKDELAAHPAAAHLDTLWAPLLLLHLGGQDGISAYSVEDNENWRRHLLIAVSQITVAIYVFRKSWWSDDGRLLRAAILLFVPGILKCLEKPWVLKNATVASIMSSSDSRMEATLRDVRAKSTTTIASLDGYLAAAAACVTNPQREPFEAQVGDEPYHLFVDLAHPYSVRLNNLRHFAGPPDPAAQAEDDREFYDDVHGVVRASLSEAFDRLYTKSKHKASFGGLLRAAVVLLTFVDIGLFQRSGRRRGEYDRADVVVTYVLLCCTAALELVSACVVLGSLLPLPDDRLAQYNLIAYIARNRKHRTVRCLATLLGCRDHLDRYWCTASPEPSRRVTELVHRHLAAGWSDYIKPRDVRDNATGREGWEEERKTAVGAYRRFNDSRGRRTLERRGCVAGPALESSLCAPFDEGVLLWHLATELCYFDHVDTGTDAARLSRVISNYMAYLLFVKPEMLVPGARRRLFRTVYRWLKKMLTDKLSKYGDDPTKTMKKAPPKHKDEVARKIIQEVTTSPNVPSDHVRRAWALAHELMEFGKKKTAEKKMLTTGKKMSDDELENWAKKQGDDEMWEVIQGVWVEMLCFSAGRCRGYLHAKSLGKGGEYLSYVWLLLSYMGMETMPERMQRQEVPAMEGDTGALVRSPDQVDDDEPQPESTSAPEPAATNGTPQQHPPEAKTAAATSSAVVPIAGDDDNV